jgi:hypothetical protein
MMPQGPKNRTIDRSAWPTGPWDAELEDHHEWHYHGVACLMLRRVLGYWCGYVSVPLSSVEKLGDLGDLDVHGGVSYSAPGDENAFWIGFHCDHHTDLAPGRALCPIDPPDLFEGCVYWEANQVRAEVERLADQVIMRMREQNS